MRKYLSRCFNKKHFSQCRISYKQLQSQIFMRTEIFDGEIGSGHMHFEFFNDSYVLVESSKLCFENLHFEGFFYKSVEYVNLNPTSFVIVKNNFIIIRALAPPNHSGRFRPMSSCDGGANPIF